MSLYTDLVKADVPIQSHEGNLHCPVTPQSVDILARHSYAARTFVHHRDGQRWYDIPGAFDPWWETHPRPDAARPRT